MLSKIKLQLILIDPDDDLRFLLKALLELTGCRVEAAKNYPEAFALINASPPDIIFTELFLDEATVLDLGRQIRSLPRAQDTLLVALTGHYYQGLVQDAWTAGFDRFLLKPVQYDQIMNILKHVTKIRGHSFGEMVSTPLAAA